MTKSISVSKMQYGTIEKPNGEVLRLDTAHAHG